jgi:CheY-like chemotaxis protein
MTDEGSTQAALPTVLIVDDEPDILDLLRDVLESEGLTVFTASNGRAALYLIQRSPVALVLTDWMMPHVSGIDLARQLRSNPATTTIPLLLMSAAMPQHISDMFAAVIHKPFALDTVIELVREFLPVS